MIMFTKLLFIVLAVSMDGFTVGISYGLRKLTISFMTVSIIMLCSGLVIFSSMTLGQIVSRFFPLHYMTYSGGLLFIALGIFLFLSTRRARKQDLETQTNKYHSFIEDPTIIDRDQSGSISFKEAVVLGIALALDAFAAGLAAAFIGFPTLLTTCLIAIASGAFVSLGFHLGKKLSRYRWINDLVYLPAIILISIGCLSFF